jgi:hypothetical protein
MNLPGLARGGSLLRVEQLKPALPVPDAAVGTDPGRAAIQGYSRYDSGE